MEERQTLRQATKLWQEAYRYQMEGELDRASERYQRSIEAHPTAGPFMSSKAPCGWYRATTMRRRCFITCALG